MSIDILQIDAVSESEQGHEFELKGMDDEGTGVLVTVIGKHADPVTKWTAKLLNAMQREHVLAQKKGVPPPQKTLEELKEQNVEGAAVRVTGWRNVKQDFSQDLLKQVLRRNPHFVDQIIKESDDLGNFTKKP